MTSQDIAEIVRYCRKQSGLSQQELAKLAGVGKTSVFDIEKGKNSVRLITLMNVFDVLNIRLQLLPPITQSTDEKQ